MVSALHHSRDVGPAKNEAPRGQKKTTEVEEAGLEKHSGLRAPDAPAFGDAASQPG